MNLLVNGNEVILIKSFSLVLLGIYLIFAIVVIRQVKFMGNTLHVGLEKQLQFLSYIHLVFAILVFLAALIIL